jgi:hypothetical protein
MLRWLLFVVVPLGLVGLVGASCHPKSYAESDGGDDGGDDGACSCSLGAANVPCNSESCVDGIIYECSAFGTTLPGGSCDSGLGDGEADGEGGPDNCISNCTGQTCNNIDNCGELCKCNPGVPCNPNGTCGNGCEGFAEALCLIDAGEATACCADGYQCQASDSGATTCCVVSGGVGQCAQNTDCCDYPKVMCNTSSGTCQ